jgi:hypothetical protein
MNTIRLKSEPLHASVIWAAARVLILTSAAFDWPAAHLPANVRHVGTPEDGAKPVQEGNEWLTDGKGPFIVVSLSSSIRAKPPP